MFRRVAFGAVLGTCLLHGAGYKIPEQSNDSVALLASNVAVSFGPDTAYYNPANMMFLSEPRHYFENTLAWFHINEAKFRTNGGETYRSNDFDSMASTFHFVSPERYENIRFGLSLAVPAGLGMGWDKPHPSFTGKRFKLKVIELNPSMAYRVSDSFAVGFGLRALYTKGRVATNLYGSGQRELEGDALDYGYNLAMTYKPTENWSLAATYRSKVDLDVKGDADIDYNGALPINIDYNGKVKVSVPLPAQLALATAYKWQDTTFMFVYERTYWSAFDGYDFEYPDYISRDATSNAIFYRAFDEKVDRNYRDTNTFRIGIAHELNEKIRLMAGFTYDQGAAKNRQSVSFDLPDTKAYAYAAGINYKFSEDLELSFGGLYQDRQKSKASMKHISSGSFPGATSQLEGEFEKAKIWIISTGIKYKF